MFIKLTYISTYDNQKILCTAIFLIYITVQAVTSIGTSELKAISYYNIYVMGLFRRKSAQSVSQKFPPSTK